MSFHFLCLTMAPSTFRGTAAPHCCLGCVSLREPPTKPCCCQQLPLIPCHGSPQDLVGDKLCSTAPNG